jgi:hypothetical protein
MVTTLGWLSREAIRASASKRRILSGSPATSDGITLIAISRSSLGSRAR